MSALDNKAQSGIEMIIIVVAIIAVSVVAFSILNDMNKSTTAMVVLKAKALEELSGSNYGNIYIELIECPETADEIICTINFKPNLDITQKQTMQNALDGAASDLGTKLGKLVTAAIK